MTTGAYPFLSRAGRIINSGQARTLILTGNIHDLFQCATAETVEYVPLASLLMSAWNVSGIIPLVYELNGPIRFVQPADRGLLRDAWLRWRTGYDADTLAVETMLSAGKVRAELETMSRSFDANLNEAVGSPTVALELLRQMCLCSRSPAGGGPALKQDLLILIESADMVIPQGEIGRLSDADRHRIGICQDWFSDPGFMSHGDTVVLLSESRSLINERVQRLPQVLEIKIDAPDESERADFIAGFERRQPAERPLSLGMERAELARLTAGLSIHALMQLLKGACYDQSALNPADVVAKVEEFIRSQLGEDVVEFKKPTHTLADVVGFGPLKAFLKSELMPRLNSAGADALSGAAVCGPIGVGKTFIFEALAGELDMVVLVLKNIRSQWFGQTDVIFERLKRVLDALAKVLIFVDEADTQFGGVGPDAHDTERRLTGKIQALMSDSALRGRVIWLLMTARIHLLSPDIRRPGRVGDLIIPVLDPQGPDREEFIAWAVKPVLQEEFTPPVRAEFTDLTADYSAAGFAALRSELIAKAHAGGGKLSVAQIGAAIRDQLSPAIAETRRYQTLQALINCTRRSLLPDPSVGEVERRAWEAEIRELESRGVR
jgi:SpoVK/Ycf46/Vps4 family AAA+-type ATPase